MTTPPSPQGQEDPSVWTSLGLAWELGYLIALPIVILGFGGAYLDKKFGTSPLLLILGFVLAFAVSAVTVIRKIKEITRKEFSQSPPPNPPSAPKP